MAVGSTTVNGGSAISDTGTSLIAGPQSAISSLAHALGSTNYNPNTGVGCAIPQAHSMFSLQWEISCNATGPDLVVKIKGKNYPIDYKNYIVPVCFCFLCLYDVITTPGWHYTG